MITKHNLLRVEKIQQVTCIYIHNNIFYLLPAYIIMKKNITKSAAQNFHVFTLPKSVIDTPYIPPPEEQKTEISHPSLSYQIKTYKPAHPLPKMDSLTIQVQQTQNQCSHQKYIGKYFHQKRSSSSIDIPEQKNVKKSLKYRSKSGFYSQLDKESDLLKALEDKARVLKVAGNHRKGKESGMVVFSQRNKKDDLKVGYLEKLIIKKKNENSTKNINGLKETRKHENSPTSSKQNSSLKSIKLLNQTIFIQPPNLYTNLRATNTKKEDFYVTANKASLSLKKDQSKQKLSSKLLIRQGYNQQRKKRSSFMNVAIQRSLLETNNKVQEGTRIIPRKHVNNAKIILPQISGWETIDDQYLTQIK